MPRTIDLTIPAEKVEAVLQRLDGIEGVVGIVRHCNASLRPPGDVLTIQTTNDATRPVLRVLDELQVVGAGSVVTSEPRSLISPEHQERINAESNETTWDEMAFLIRQDTNLAPNFLVLMAAAGAVSAVGLWTNTLHLVIAAMVIAPAFEPLTQIAFGLVVGPGRSARSGVVSTVAGYLQLALGGLLSVLILQAIDPTRSDDLETRSWVRYWTTVTPTGVLVSAFAAAAGGFVISGQRSVLTTGVMIALALVPSMAIVGMGLGAGDFALAGRGFVRWLVDMGLVLVISGAVVAVKRVYLDYHRSLS